DITSTIATPYPADLRIETSLDPETLPYDVRILWFGTAPHGGKSEHPMHSQRLPGHYATDDEAEAVGERFIAEWKRVKDPDEKRRRLGLWYPGMTDGRGREVEHHEDSTSRIATPDASALEIIVSVDPEQRPW